ncbi:hypothetical protein DL765_007953 [Monosporascus sp. GIB2]|nr:hypothetical protein DL765_007953 [Monosporascus sp. GIB2]
MVATKSHILLGGLVSLTPLVLGTPLDTRFSDNNIIEKDVAVIGGGSSGTYAAIRLKDLGADVVVIEKAEELGGHAQTYTAAGGVSVDYGVSNFQNYAVVQDFFARFDLPITSYAQAGNVDRYIDFTTGQDLPNGTIPAPDFTAYFEQLDKYPYLQSGWDLPYPVPEDLLLPFGKFVEKYGLQSVAYIITLFAAGHGNVLEQTTAYVLKAVDRPYLEGILSGTSVTPANNDTHELYVRALEVLGSDALLSSTVACATRSDNGVELVVNTPDGEKIVKANKLLISAPPTLDNLTPFGLDEAEEAIFSQFEHNALYVGLLENTGLEAGVRYYNADSSADGEVNPYNVANLPGVQMVWATRAEGIYWAWYSSPTETSEEKVKSDTIAAIQRLSPGSEPAFVAYDSHTPFAVGVSPEAIADGFYRKLYSLQGYKSTWYTGAAFVTAHSSALWNFTEYEILPRLQQRQ